MMTIRSLLLATALLAAITATARAQVRDDVIAAPVLRANVTVSGDVVRIGDVIDNAGTWRRSRSTARPIWAPPARCRPRR
jgi:flagellar basal body P-ring formation protein FlgA